jgi:hypothetical protein
MLALARLVIVPLDAARFHWSPVFPIWLKVLGGLMLLPALFLIQRATMETRTCRRSVCRQSVDCRRVVLGDDVRCGAAGNQNGQRPLARIRDARYVVVLLGTTVTRTVSGS